MCFQVNAYQEDNMLGINTSPPNGKIAILHTERKGHAKVTPDEETVRVPKEATVLLSLILKQLVDLVGA